jgi:SAM-dependent methyltransferase
MQLESGINNIMEIISPLTRGKNVQFERNISCAFLVKEYMRKFSIDVSKYLDGLKSVSVYRCNDTGLRFYSPSNIDGDSVFYEQLQAFPWYYMNWKWEHEEVQRIISKNDKVLEIGCAQGAFVEVLEKSGVKVSGLELNSTAVKIAQSKGLTIFEETIEQHALNNREAYDVVCSFQVMEHIADLKSVIESSLHALNKGGKLIISVPNNNSFIKNSPYDILNMPPHHMCLWDGSSLKNIQNYFNLSIEKIIYEPLQPYHYGNYLYCKLYALLKNRFLVNTIFKVTTLLHMHKLLSLVRNKIPGHTIIAVYLKA